MQAHVEWAYSYSALHLGTMSDPQHTTWQALAGQFGDMQQQLLASVMQPFSQGAGQLDAGETLQQLAQDYVRDPARWQQLQQSWYEQQLALWTRLSSPDAPKVDAAAVE